MTVHIIGAGLAGLSAAVRLTAEGRSVVLYEAANHGGGRCRSFYDETLKRKIDNGNHLLLSGNTEAMTYLRAIDSFKSMVQPDRAEYPFKDLESGERWQVNPGRSRFPFWLFSSQMRVPGSTVWDYLSGLKLAWAGDRTTVAETLDPSRPLFRKFWEPLCVAVLNTAVEEGAAQLLWPVLKQTFGQGEGACRPCIAEIGLSESLIDPAIQKIEENGGAIKFNKRLKSINFVENYASELIFANSEISLASQDFVILALPAEIAGSLLPGKRYPDQFRAIVNAHFLLPEPQNGIRFLGLIGGVSQWLFVRDDVASVTVSAADDLVDKSSDDIAAILWPELLKALELEQAPISPFRIIKEKRATFAQTPDQAKLRPDSKTDWTNLFLAGDWTSTGLPATIEGAITSGHRAAGRVNAIGAR